jgi:acetylornithine deacetylase/succinyl-diaminopimelate desuccinylase-like protein
MIKSGKIYGRGVADMKGGMVCLILALQRGVMNAGSNPHGVNETIKLKDVKAFIKELIIFLCADL